MSLINSKIRIAQDFGVVQEFDLAKENLNGLFSNATLLTMMLLSLSKNRQLPKAKASRRSSLRHEYDYVIVGGGSAGSVMANRLSQKSCVSVLLLEAGGDAPFLSEIPSFSRLLYGSSIDWLYRTVPQKYAALGQNENRVFWNSGRGLGGGSILNAMLYVRGNMRNYDAWEKEGATGWGYKDVLPYFLKLEDNRNIEELDFGYHKTFGPMTAEKPRYNPEIKEPILAATAALGFELTDPNGARQTGIYDLQGTIRNGQRCSTAKAYLEPAEGRPNLKILRFAFARKILIKNRKAYGVQFDYGGETREVYARKEVIISSGTVRAAQILMLSGIGPSEHLKKFNIPVVADLPVGKNLQDHACTQMNFLVNSTIKEVFFKSLSPLNTLQYITSRSGPLASPSQCTVLAFLDGLKTTPYSKDFPRQQLYFAEFSTIDPFLNANIRPEVYQQIYGPYTFRPSYTCLVSQLKPYSRGEILLDSTNPYDTPLINPNYFKDERDIRDLVEGLKICLAVGNSPEMQKVQSRPYETIYPGCERFVGNIDQYFACVARTVTLSFWHTVGTARMGQRDDPRSVVDPQLRVIGVDNLRVICAAVMPIIPSGNTNIPTIMVAEKAYDMMKNDILCERDLRKEKIRVAANLHQTPVSETSLFDTWNSSFFQDGLISEFGNKVV